MCGILFTYRPYALTSLRGQNHCLVRACATGTFLTTAVTRNPIEKFDPQVAAWRHMHKFYYNVKQEEKTSSLFTDLQFFSRVYGISLLPKKTTKYLIFTFKISMDKLHTVGPRLSGHQLSGYLYYPAMILQYIVYCLYCLFSTTVLLKTKTK